LSSDKLLFINGAILTVCAVFIDTERELLLTGLMLFLPFIDRSWAYPKSLISSIVDAPSGTQFNQTPTPQKHYSLLPLQASLFLTSIMLIALNSDYTQAAISTLLLTALPEEWFFRAYFMTRLERYIVQGFFSKNATASSPFLNDLHKKYSGLSANILTSSLFALLHTPTQGWFGLTIFFPSLFYGWVYQKTRNLLLVILLHALSNIVFFIYLSDLTRWGS